MLVRSIKSRKTVQRKGRMRSKWINRVEIRVGEITEALRKRRNVHGFCCCCCLRIIEMKKSLAMRLFESFSNNPFHQNRQCSSISLLHASSRSQIWLPPWRNQNPISPKGGRASLASLGGTKFLVRNGQRECRTRRNLIWVFEEI